MAHTRGRLCDPVEAPPRGETVHLLVELGSGRVEQILSGRLDGPVDYVQDADEWVMVVHGRATLEVEGDRTEMGPGDWVLLPAGTAHRLVATDPGTSWLAVTTAPAPARPRPGGGG